MDQNTFKKKIITIKHKCYIRQHIHEIFITNKHYSISGSFRLACMYLILVKNLFTILFNLLAVIVLGVHCYISSLSLSTCLLANCGLKRGVVSLLVLLLKKKQLVYSCQFPWAHFRGNLVSHSESPLVNTRTC